MTFDKEMDLFFSRNCYFEKERDKVKAAAAYQRAVEMKDVTQAQEIATRILEAGLPPVESMGQPKIPATAQTVRLSNPPQ